LRNQRIVRHVRPASRPFADTVLRNKPVAVIGASTGMFGAVWSQAELRKRSRQPARASSTANCPLQQRTKHLTRAVHSRIGS
jgi:hypothetical protein